MVFVSHANPEENELALGLSLQLANEGYAVWCDLTKLLGGEKFWEDIQEAISTRTAKFVYILSRPPGTSYLNARKPTAIQRQEFRHHRHIHLRTLESWSLPLSYPGVAFSS